MKRIHGEQVEINHEKMHTFWDNRAQTYSKENPYTSVKLRANKDQELEAWDMFEKDLIFRTMQITSNTTVIDIGCGVGRMAKHLIPAAAYYLGVDYSEPLIELAKEHVGGESAHDFLVCDATKISADLLEANQLPNTYDAILIIGCMQYLNDEEVRVLVLHLLEMANEVCRIYITNAEAQEQRLTLKDFDSEVLGEYSSIYRTHEEYLSLFAPLFAHGFVVTNHAPLSISEHYQETVHTYMTLQREKE